MTSPIIEEWCAWMTAQGLSQRTIKERQMLFTRLKGDVDLRPGDLIRELGRDGLTNSSKATYTNHMRAFYQWAMLMEYTDTDPTSKLPTPRVPRGQPHPVTDAEIARLSRSKMRAKTRAMVLLCAYQGLRIHEAVKVRGEDIDPERGIITVVGKGKVKANLPLSSVIRELAANMPQEGYWFPSGDLHVKANSASDTVGKAMRRAGVNASAHSLRHWYGTQLMKRGANMRVTQELMRHSNPATTAIYTQVDEDQKRAAIDSLAA
ncbi:MULTISPECIES: tyrosine-type recombinase/integrase [unclassified Brevibacterium]|uniref:tyrosine-type recombinase/integrase n=1 Tax=unclassified Brevibacterium TaxID=2614124 RepID=UPI001E59FABC|nr:MULTISPECIES: tyrosine-type recombinase/integrase [unclassified Brevibacterium]MDK8434301.1 tyrosine-type recombinase/integrase [Brevibacterium sp. H-BE7]